MATLSTATSNFADLVTDLIRKTAEDELRSNLPHGLPDQTMPIAWIKGTNQFRLARYADLAAQTTALTEGTPPNAQSLTIASEAFTATQLGGVLEVTDLALAYSPHDLIAVNAERAGRQAAATIDVQLREIIAAGASVQYVTATSRATLAASNPITGAYVKRMVATLVKNNVPRFPDGSYRCILHPYASYDLFTDTTDGGWMDANKYNTNLPLLVGELGSYHGVRFLEAAGTGTGTGTGAKIFVDGGAASADVYSSVFYGPDFLARGDVQQLASYFVAPGGDHSDPIAQLAKIGWKVDFGATLVDEAGPRYIRLEHGATLGT